jgi:alkylation response protein AidB-like acyl-CoA dehydrogenase
MNFDLTDDQRMLVDTVTTFVKKESPVSRFRQLRDEDGVGFSREVWKKMGDLGWLAIPFAEDVGGMGGSFVDLMLVLEPLGAALVPEPILSSIVLGGMAIERGGSAEQRAKYLPPVIAGEKTLALAYAEAESGHQLHHVATSAEKTSNGFRIRGEKRWVLDGHAADTFVVSARTGGEVGSRDGIGLFLVDRSEANVKPVRTLDGRRAAMVSFDVEIPADRRLGGEAFPVLERVIDGAAAAACAEGLGVMTASLGLTRDYISQREQFGVKIGSFQALQHRCVDMFVETELARGTAILAAIRESDADPEQRRRGVSVAKVHLATGGRFVVQQAIQLHGGIGITDEADIGLYFKRMHVLEALFGDEDHHLARLSNRA